MNWWRLRFGEHRDLRKRVLESFRLKDTIKAIDSETYGSIGGHKHSLDQDTLLQIDEVMSWESVKNLRYEGVQAASRQTHLSVMVSA
jgi:hypothetical protein